jgi:hypothetical protein
MKRESKSKSQLPKSTPSETARLNDSNDSFGGAVIVTKSGKPPSAAPILPAPGWARYVDSRLKQFCSR